MNKKEFTLSKVETKIENYTPFLYCYSNEEFEGDFNDFLVLAPFSILKNNPLILVGVELDVTLHPVFIYKKIGTDQLKPLSENIKIGLLVNYEK